MNYIRNLGPFEIWRLKQHLLRLSPEERRQRFFGSVSDEAVATHCAGIYGVRVIVIGFFADGVLRGAAELRLEMDIAGRAELAITVETAWQDSGVGTALVERAVTAAGNRGARSLFMVCLLDNRQMQHIAGKLTDRLIIVEDQVEADLVTPFPTYISLWLEAATEGVGVMSSWLDHLPLGGVPVAPEVSA